MRTAAALLFFICLAHSCPAQTVPIEVTDDVIRPNVNPPPGPPAPGPTPLRMDVKAERRELDVGQRQRINLTLSKPFELVVWGVSDDGTVDFDKDSANKFVILYATNDTPALQELIVIQDNKPVYRLILTTLKGPRPPPGPAPRPTWKHMDALEKAFAQDKGQPAEAVKVNAIFRRVAADTTLTTAARFYSALKLEYRSAALPLKNTLDTLGDVMSLEVGPGTDTPFTDAQKASYRAFLDNTQKAFTYLSTLQPAPGPTPPGPNPPGPNPPGPGPAPSVRPFEVFIVFNPTQNHTPPQLTALYSGKVFDYLDAKSAKVNGRPGWRRWPADINTSAETPEIKALWAKAQAKLQGVNLPAVAVVTDQGVDVLPVTTEAALLDFLTKFGGQ